MVTKPLSPILNTKISISSGLVFDAELYENTGTTTHDLVNQTAGTLSGAGVTWSTSPFGVVLDSTPADGSQAVNFTTAGSVQTLGTFSVEVLLKIRSWSATNEDRIVQKGGGSTEYWTMGARANTAGHLEFDMGFSSADRSIAITDFPQNNWAHLVVTVNGDGATPIFYLNGAVDNNTTSIGASSGTRNADTTDLALCNKSQSVGGRGGDLQMAYMRYWNRVLSAAEAALLSSDHFTVLNQPNLINFRP